MGEEAEGEVPELNYERTNESDWSSIFLLAPFAPLPLPEFASGIRKEGEPLFMIPNSMEKTQGVNRVTLPEIAILRPINLATRPDIGDLRLLMYLDTLTVRLHVTYRVSSTRRPRPGCRVDQWSRPD